MNNQITFCLLLPVQLQLPSFRCASVCVPVRTRHGRGIWINIERRSAQREERRTWLEWNGTFHTWKQQLLQFKHTHTRTLSREDISFSLTERERERATLGSAVNGKMKANLCTRTWPLPAEEREREREPKTSIFSNSLARLCVYLLNAMLLLLLLVAFAFVILERTQLTEV